MDKFVFVLTVYNEVEYTLQTIQELNLYYPESKKVIIFDGTSHPEIEDECVNTNIRIVHGDQLFLSDMIGWIKRWMITGISEAENDDDWIVRFEPEIETKGRLTKIPNCDVFGCFASKSGGCKNWQLQGPAIFIRKRCINHILYNKLLDNPIYNSKQFYTYRLNAFSDTHIVSHVIRSSNFIVVDHPELYLDIYVDKSFYPSPYKMIHPRWWDKHIKRPQEPKVFDISLSIEYINVISNKLKQLGYTPLHYPFDYINISNKSDAFNGLSICSYFEYLDKQNPDSIFIMVCDYNTDNFIKYCNSYLENEKEKWKHDFFFRNLKRTIGHIDFNNQYEVSIGMKKYYNKVKDYFQNRPHDIIWMDNISDIP